MTRLTALAATATLLIAGPALAQDRSFTKDGITYSYTVKSQGATRILSGYATQGGRFRLVVKNGWVRGYVASTPVSFPAPKRSDATQVAQR